MIDEFRVRGWDHPGFEGLEHRVGIYKAVTGDSLGVVVRSLFRDGAKRVVIEEEASWIETERETKAWDRGEEIP